MTEILFSWDQALFVAMKVLEERNTFATAIGKPTMSLSEYLSDRKMDVMDIAHANLDIWEYLQKYYYAEKRNRLKLIRGGKYELP